MDVKSATVTTYTVDVSDYANIFGESNADNSIDQVTITYTIEDTTQPRVYLKPLTAANNAATNSCTGTAISGITSMDACRKNNMRNVIPHAPWNTETECGGCNDDN